MKILFQSRVDLFDLVGGDTVQIQQTKDAIEKLYKNIKIDISTKLKDENIEQYDLVHLFNLDWIPETYIQIKHAKKYKKPVVLSAIHHSEEEVKRYEKYYRFDLRRIVNLILPSQPIRDEAKNVYRSIFNYKKIHPTAIQLLKGIRATQREILKLTDVVLVQTDAEAKDIASDFNYKDFKWVKVVNGVNTDIFLHPDKKLFYKNIKLDKKEKIILNVGRIEPRKNQLKLIEAFEKLIQNPVYSDYTLIFIGAINKYHYEYYTKFLNKVKNNDKIFYLGQQKQDFIASAMSNGYIYVQPSWFETSGLVTIEAYISGMKIVAAGERIAEYLKENVVMCDPASSDSVKNAIIKSINTKYNQKLIDYSIKNYTWDNAAKQTIDVYKSLVK